MASASKRRGQPASADLKEGLALFQHADALALQGRLGESLDAYERALILLPKDAGLLLSFARLRLRLDESEKAETLLRRAVALKAGAEASLLLGALLKKKGEASQARAHLRRAADDKPKTSDRRTLMASGLTRFQANVKLGAFKEAFQEAEALLDAEGSQECIDSFFVSPDQGELIATLEALKAFSLQQPKNPWPYYFRATLLTNTSRGEEAISEIEKLRKMPKRYDWMRHKHGEFLLTSRRDYAGAEKEYAAALECVPGFWKARAALAEIALCQGRPADAANLAAELIKALPTQTRPWGHACLGKMRLWSGEYERALESLAPAVDFGVPDSVRHRGGARMLLGRLDEAVADLDAALAQGVDAEGLTWRGELKRRRGDLKGAVEDLSAAIRLDSANSFWALANRALAKGAGGDQPGMWSDFSTIRRDVLDRFETAAGLKAASAQDSEAIRTVLEAGLRLARGMRVANEYLFPIWMGHGREA